MDFEDTSLLFPPGVPRPRRKLINQKNPAYDIKDLGIKRLVRAMSISGVYEGWIEEVLLTPINDPRILNYRLDVIDDLLRSPRLLERLQDILTLIVDLESYLVQPDWEDSEIQQVAWRLSELENYVDGVVALNDLLSGLGERLESDALVRLRERVAEIADEPSFIRLRDELPELIDRFRGVQSITIGINLDNQMRPMEAMLLTVNRGRFRGRAVLNWFFGGNNEDIQDKPVGPVRRRANFDIRISQQDGPVLSSLFDDLEAVMEETCKPIAKALQSYTGVNSRLLTKLKNEIAFYLGAVQFIAHLKKSGMPVCRPEPLTMEARVCHLRDLYNPALVLNNSAPHNPVDVSKTIVTNDLDFDDEGRVFILTGPNRGGKTTYTVAVGLAQVLFQAGLYVPARSAKLSPVDGIYTHFATAENPHLETGRLGEESIRLNTVFQFATRHSLILLNETFASTSAVESLYLTRDVVRVIRLMGARCVFATHLHELAADCERINNEVEGDSKLISMVSQVDLDEDDPEERARRTYKIVPGPPVGTSYAREIAARYGISYTKLTGLLRERDILPPETQVSD